MTTSDFIMDWFGRVDDWLQDMPQQPQAQLWPSEVVPRALGFALKGVGPRPFYRGLIRASGDLFPHLPERPRLFRLFNRPWRWRSAFMAEATLLGASIPTGLNGSTRSGKGAVRPSWAARACLTITASLASSLGCG